MKPVHNARISNYIAQFADTMREILRFRFWHQQAFAEYLIIPRCNVMLQREDQIYINACVAIYLLNVFLVRIRGEQSRGRYLTLMGLVRQS